MFKQTLLLIFLFSSILLQSCATQAPKESIKKPVLESTQPAKAATTPPITSAITSMTSTETGDMVELSTKLFKEKRSRIKTTFVDSYVKAIINKKTGEITYQINSLAEYKDHDKRQYKKVSYSAVTQREQKETILLDYQISCQGSAYSGCIHTEHVTFNVEKALMEHIAQNYTDAKDATSTWRYQLIPQSGRNHSAQLLLSEIAALVEKANNKLKK